MSLSHSLGLGFRDFSMIDQSTGVCVRVSSIEVRVDRGAFLTTREGCGEGREGEGGNSLIDFST